MSFVSFALLPEIALVVARLQGFRGPLDGATSVNLRGSPFQIISLHTSYMSGVGLKVREGESACTVMLC